MKREKINLVSPSLKERERLARWARKMHKMMLKVNPELKPIGLWPFFGREA